MSTPPLPPEDRPTEVVRPARVAREPLPADPYVAGTYAETPVATAALADSLRSLRTALAILALFTVAALALAFYALQEANGDDADGRGASQARVAKLEDRVGRLVSLVKDTRSDVDALKTSGAGASAGQAGASDVDDLRSQLKALDGRVTALQDAGGEGGDEGTQSAIDALGSRVDELAQQVKDLQDQQSQQTP